MRVVGLLELLSEQQGEWPHVLYMEEEGMLP